MKRWVTAAAMALCGALLACVARPLGAQTLEILHSFDVNASEPFSRVIQGSDGAFYGAANRGGGYGDESIGRSGLGILFKLSGDGSGFRILHAFNQTDGRRPYAGPVEGSDGALYGTTVYGGVKGDANGSGVVYRVEKDGTGFQKLHDFDNTDGAGPWGGVVEGSDGALYGTAGAGGANGRGTVFKLNKDGTGFLTLHDFNDSDGAYPWAGVAEASDGVLYGTTQAGGMRVQGVVFKLNKDGTGFKIIHDFLDSPGDYPKAGVMEGSDGILYGTADGEIFKVNKDGTGYLTLHNLGEINADDSWAPPVEGSDGILYGTASGGGANNNGVVFKLRKDGSDYMSLHDFDGSDGSSPVVALVQGSDAALYGTTVFGGDHGGGVVFKLEKDGTGFLTLHDFGGEGGGVTHPYAGLEEGSEGALYGTTYSGGANGEGGAYGSGTVFKLEKDGSGFLKLHSFDHNAGANPYAGVVEGSDGLLYGTTQGGGGNDDTIFRLDKDGSGYLLLRDLDEDSDGTKPYAGLTEGSDGALYGTAQSGGEFSSGVVFKLNKDGSGFLKLHDFDGEDGASPYAGLVEGSDGALYGTTQGGGELSSGVVFKLSKDGSYFRKLHDFEGDDGANPYAGLVEGVDGALYGTAQNGGFNGYGIVFKVNKDGSGFLNLHDFDKTDGAHPYAGLVEGSDGALYGTTYQGGAYDSGIIFRLNNDGTAFENLADFNYKNGANPYAGLIEASNGALYGTARNGGPGAGGIVFRLRLHCEARIQAQGSVHAPGDIVPIQIHLAHYRSETVTVPWELRLLDASGQLVDRRTTEPLTFKPGDVVDRDVEFRLPNDLASGTYTLGLAISGMAGTKGATTNLRVVRIAEETR